MYFNQLVCGLCACILLCSDLFCC